MKVTTERLPESRMLLNIEVEEVEVEEYKQRAYRKLVNRTNIPGFRKGKAPRRILEQYVGSETLISEVIDDLINETTARAIQENDIESVGQPTIDLEGLDPITFKATVPLKPTVDLGDYRSLRVPYEVPEVTEEQVQEVLDRLNQENTPWEPKDGPVEMGEMTALTIQAYVKGLDPEHLPPQQEEEDTGAQEGEHRFLHEEGWTYHPRPDSTFPVPGFADQIVGMEKGETKEFAIQAPEDHTIESLAGKETRFVVTVEEIKAQHSPAIDDEWAKGIGDGYESLDALKQSIHEDLQRQTEQRAEGEYEDQLLRELKQRATTEHPPDLIDHELEHLVDDRRQRLGTMGVSFEQYLTMMGRTEEQLREDLREEAQDRVINTLLLNQLAENEGIEVTEEDMAAEKQRLLGDDPPETQRLRVEQIFESPAGRSSITQSVMARKAMERLKAIAMGKTDGADAPAAEETPTQDQPAEASLPDQNEEAEERS